MDNMGVCTDQTASAEPHYTDNTMRITHAYVDLCAEKYKELVATERVHTVDPLTFETMCIDAFSYTFPVCHPDSRSFESFVEMWIRSEHSTEAVEFVRVMRDKLKHAGVSATPNKRASSGAGGVAAMAVSGTASRKTPRGRLCATTARFILTCKDTRTRRTASMLADRFGVSSKCIRDIWTYKCWNNETACMHGRVASV